MIPENTNGDFASGEVFYNGNVGLGTNVMFPWSTDLNVIRLGDLGSIVTSKTGMTGGGQMSIGYNYFTDVDGIDRFMTADGANKIVINNTGTYSYQSAAGVAGEQVTWQGNGSFALVEA